VWRPGIPGCPRRAREPTSLLRDRLSAREPDRLLAAFAKSVAASRQAVEHARQYRTLGIWLPCPSDEGPASSRCAHEACRVSGFAAAADHPVPLRAADHADHFYDRRGQLFLESADRPRDGGRAGRAVRKDAIGSTQNEFDPIKALVASAAAVGTKQPDFYSDTRCLQYLFSILRNSGTILSAYVGLADSSF